MKNRSFRVLLILTTVLTIFLVLISSTIFNVSNIVVTGNNRVTDEQVFRSAEIGEETNIFSFSKRRARGNILENLYIEDVKINSSLLRSEIEFVITERNLSGYIEHSAGMFLYIDEHGRVLDNKTYYTEQFPIIEGLKFNSFQVGEILEVNNTASFETIVLLNSLINKHDMGSDVIRINVEDPNYITMNIDNVFIRFGTTSDADEKMLILNAIMKNIPNEEMRWILDITDISRPLVLEVMT